MPSSTIFTFSERADTTSRAIQTPRKNVIMIDSVAVFIDIHIGDQSIFLPPFPMNQVERP